MQNKITEALKTIDEKVFYGAVTEKDFQELDSADCIVFATSDFKKKAVDSRDLVFTYDVFIVRENYIPENTILSVIKAVENIPQLRLVGQSNLFEYVKKGKTNVIVESVCIKFSRTVKRFH